MNKWENPGPLSEAIEERARNEYKAWLADRCATQEHNWVDITTLDSPDNTWLCVGCGLTKTEPKQHWPLYPYTQPITTDRGIGTTTFKVWYPGNR